MTTYMPALDGTDIDTAFGAITVTDTEKALLRILMRMEERLRRLEGGLSFTTANFLDDVVAQLPET